MNPKKFTFRSTLLLLLFTAFCWPETISAQTVNWIGGNETDPASWAIGENWDSGVVPSAVNDVVIPATANSPVIRNGTNAEAISVTVEEIASLTIETSGSLILKNAVDYGLDNEGTVVNSGTISIDITGSHAVFNASDATFTNKSNLNIGQIEGGISGVGVYNNSVFVNEEAGDLRIDNTTSDGINNVANSTFTNTAILSIGSNGGNIGRYGISNDSGFNNLSTGVFNIDNVTVDGIRNKSDGTFINEATVNIGLNGGNISRYGISNEFAFTTTGEINIQNTGDVGINNQFSFGNANGGNINIGNTGSFALFNTTAANFININNALLYIGQGGATINAVGIYNESNFQNLNGSEIRVDHTTSHAVYNINGIFINEGLVKIGQFGGSIAGQGIRNTAEFNNTNIGDLSIANTGNTGIFNTSIFNNTSNAVITIDAVASDAIFNSTGTFTNSATINIGQNEGIDNIGLYGIWNKASFNNSGSINIDNTSVDGMYNFGGADFTNSGALYIGQTDGNITWAGMLNYGTFSNEGSGDIRIDNVGLDAIYNVNNSSFTNTATIDIGQNGGNIADYGIWTQSSIFNNNGGNVNIANTGLSGIRNVTNNVFTNSGTLSITNTALSAIFNDSGIFTNSATINIGQGGAINNITDHGIYNANSFSNAPGGNINIDNTGDFAIYNFTAGTFTNEAGLNIGQNNGNINSSGIYNLAIFDNTTVGNIKIDNTSDHGINNLNGTITNEGSLSIGELGVIIPGQGIRNLAAVENRNSGNISIANTIGSGIVNTGNINNTSGAVINIDQVDEDGILNNAGTIDNQAAINIGQNEGIDNINRHAIWNKAVFSNSGNGIITIDNAKDFALHNFSTGDFINEAEINIGQNDGNIKQAGIYNQSNFSNLATGHIRIDNIESHGIYNFNGIFTNEASIDIGKSVGNISGHGIRNAANFINRNSGTISIENAGISGIFNIDSFSNTSDAVINIDKCEYDAIFNSAGNFTNSSIINIGQNQGIDNIKRFAIWNRAVFSNLSDGVITMDNSGSFGIYNYTAGIFTNEADLNIGQNDGNINTNGIYNISDFNNIANGNIKIDNTASHGINNKGGIFNNEAIVSIGESAGNISGKGIYNSADLENKNSGIISIANTLSSGIFNSSNLTNISGGVINIHDIGADAILNHLGNFTNSATLNIGQSGGSDNIVRYAIWNRADFINNGTLNIDNTKEDGLFNTGTAVFTNTAGLNLGQNDGNINGTAILNYAIFNNSGNGVIKIDDVLLNGIYNVASSTFTNTATIDIGQNAGPENIERYGIWNKNALFSNNGGTINIANTKFSGMRNFSTGTFSNSAAINISDAGKAALWNDGSFTNNTCATIDLSGYLRNRTTATFTNDGLLYLNTTGSHDNDGVFTNNGILNYEQSNPISSVINLEIIIAPTIATACESISPAFGLGNPVDFDIQGVFSDANGVVSAGDYDVALNKFTPDPPLTEGTYDLYVKIDGGGCVSILPWELVIVSCCPSSLLITGNTQSPDCPGGNNGSISTTVSAGQAPYTYNWSNNGNGANLNNLTAGTYTVTVTDNNGCTDEASFIVPGGVDNEDPVITCPANITECGAQTISWPTPVVTDNCGVDPASIVSNPASGSFFNVGATTVTCSATDVNGNSSSCTFTVTIEAGPDINITSGPLPFGCHGLGALKANVLNAGNLTPPITYSWSNSSTDQSILIVSNGTYTVTVTDGAGCSETQSITTNIDPYTTLSSYTLVSTDEMEIEESTINGGVGVRDDEEVEIEDNSVIVGFVQADEIDLDDSTINGGSSYPYPNNPPYGEAEVDFPAFMFNTLSTGSSPDLTVGSGQTVTISSPNNVYDKIKVKENATLIVSSTITALYIRKLELEEDASIIFKGHANVMVKDEIEFEEYISITPSGPYAVTFWIEEEVKIEKGTTITANIYSLEKLESKGSSSAENYLTGLFISNDRVKSKHTTWNPNPNCSLIGNGGQNLLAPAADLLGFGASLDEHQVELMWITNTEYKNSHFIVERSSDGIDFETLYEVEPKYTGTRIRSYTDVDQQPILGTNYYRVKAMFVDGGFMYSEIKQVDFLMDLSTFNLWPNPATDEINVYLKEFASKPARVHIYNNIGKPVLQYETDALPDGPVSFELDNLRDGIYYFTIKVEGYRMQTRRFVIAKTD